VRLLTGVAPREIAGFTDPATVSMMGKSMSRGVSRSTGMARFAFDDGTHHYVEHWLGRREALMLAWHCFRKQEAKSGSINRVIITDGGDYTVFEWKRGDGITWPLPEEQ